MLRKLMSMSIVGIVTMSLMVGCSSTEDTKDDSSTTTKQEQQVKQPNETSKDTKTSEDNNQQTNTKKDDSNEAQEPTQGDKRIYTTDDGRKLTKDEYIEYLNSDEYMYGTTNNLVECPTCHRNARVYETGSMICGWCGEYIHDYLDYMSDEAPEVEPDKSGEVPVEDNSYYNDDADVGEDYYEEDYYEDDNTDIESYSKDEMYPYSDDTVEEEE